MKAAAAQLAIAIAVVSGVGAWAAPGSMHRPGDHPPRVRIRGHVVGLYPGAVRRLPVRVRNLGGRPVEVRAIRTRVRVGSRRCRPLYVTVRGSRRRLRIPSRGVRGTRLRIAMAARAPDACQGATFRLRFRALVRRPG